MTDLPNVGDWVLFTATENVPGKQEFSWESGSFGQVVTPQQLLDFDAIAVKLFCGCMDMHSPHEGHCGEQPRSNDKFWGDGEYRVLEPSEVDYLIAALPCKEARAD